MEMNNGEHGLRTLDCLRGRLLAERAASKVATEDADQIANKLIELENQLSQEIKLRNRAEKKLKILIKKLESKNISHVPEDLEHSILLERSEISSLSSTGSSCTKKSDIKELTTATKCGIEEPRESADSSVASENSYDFNASQATRSTQTSDCPLNESLCSTGEVSKPQSDAQMTISINICDTEVSNENLNQDVHHIPSIEQTGDSNDNASPDKSKEQELKQEYDASEADDNRLEVMAQEKEPSGENDPNKVGCLDNSLALVLVDVPKNRQAETVDPSILDVTVKDVLEALRHAKESLQRSMERRRMIRVGSRLIE